MNIAIVPARSGSKGIKDKNLRKINGITLVEHAVLCGLKAKTISDVYISTDSEEYECIAKKAGAKSVGLREKRLAGSNVKTIDVILDLIPKLDQKPSNIVLLQPTAPMRHPKDIDSCITMLESGEYDSIVSMQKVDEPHPYKMKVIVDGQVRSFIEGKSSEVPRQLLEDVYSLNGAIYANNYDSLLRDKTFFAGRVGAYIMKETINIDNHLDLITARIMMEDMKI